MKQSFSILGNAIAIGVLPANAQVNVIQEHKVAPWATRNERWIGFSEDDVNRRRRRLKLPWSAGGQKPGGKAASAYATR
jgi:hypothetical protein